MAKNPKNIEYLSGIPSDLSPPKQKKRSKSLHEIRFYPVNS